MMAVFTDVYYIRFVEITVEPKAKSPPSKMMILRSSNIAYVSIWLSPKSMSISAYEMSHSDPLKSALLEVNFKSRNTYFYNDFGPIQPASICSIKTRYIARI